MVINFPCVNTFGLLSEKRCVRREALPNLTLNGDFQRIHQAEWEQGLPLSRPHTHILILQFDTEFHGQPSAERHHRPWAVRHLQRSHHLQQSFPHGTRKQIVGECVTFKHFKESGLLGVAKWLFYSWLKLNIFDGPVHTSWWWWCGPIHGTAQVRAKTWSRRCDGWNTRVHILSGRCDPPSPDPSVSFLRKYSKVRTALEKIE